jgi:serine/threonine protein phosphatase PrpC
MAPLPGATYRIVDGCRKHRSLLLTLFHLARLFGGRRFGSSETRLVSHDGVVGHNMRTPLTQTIDLDPGDLIVLYTDGIHDRFTSDDYPSLHHHAPEDVARTIVDRFGKDYDDAACIAVRYSP